jgi:HSP20 family molecular chaperone IbpA
MTNDIEVATRVSSPQAESASGPSVQPQEGRSRTAAQPDAASDSGQQDFIVPPVDVYEDASGITLLADLPGVSKDRLNVRIDGDSLFVEATAFTPVPEEMQLVYGEARVPGYRRHFTLSRELDTSHIDAQLKDGVLRLFIPKAEEAKPRRIEIRTA